MRGRLLAIEGIDGAGTTTQARLLVQWMNHSGLPAHFTCEPSDRPVGRLIRRLLRGDLDAVDPAAVALLFAADRLDHLRGEVLPLLERGTHVVSDRFVYSSLTYQSVTLDPAWVGEINARAVEPDLTVYLRVEPDLARARRSARGEGQELFDAEPVQQAIADLYDRLFGTTAADGSWIQRSGSEDPAGSNAWIQQDPAPPAELAQQTFARRPRWAVLDGARPIESIQQRLRGLALAVCADADRDGGDESSGGSDP
jgi:dTMP kinase